MTIATLDQSVRLVVIQFLMRASLVPTVVPFRSSNNIKTPDLPYVGGRELLPSTKDIYLLNLLDGVRAIDGSGPYELVDSWSKERLCADNYPDGMSFVRYVFCRKEYIRTTELHPEFVTKREELIESLVNLADDNIWSVQGHLNPYFENSKPTDHKVLMLGCAGRKPTVNDAGFRITVYRDGRNPITRQGIGPKVPLTDRARKLTVVDNSVHLL